MSTPTLKSLSSKVRCAVVNYIDPPADWKDCNGFKVKLSYRRRSMTVPFYQGYGISGEPEAASVLDCLLSDATSVENARGFEDWCSDLGFDSDSRKAEATYKACERIAKRLRRLLGDDFETFANSERL